MQLMIAKLGCCRYLPHFLVFSCEFYSYTGLQIMDRLTLKFKDKALEHEYQEIQAPYIAAQFAHNLKLLFLFGVVGAIHYFTQGLFTIGVFTLSCPLYSVTIYYFLIVKKHFTYLMPFCIGAVSFMSSVFQLAPLYFDLSDEKEWLSDITLQSSMAYSLTSNIPLNIFLYFVFISIRMYARSHSGFNTLSLIVVFYSTFFIHNDYQRVKNSRQYFLYRHYNLNQLAILDFVKEPIAIVKFDSHWQKFVPYYQNLAAEQVVGKEAIIPFLKEARSASRKGLSLYDILAQGTKTLVNGISLKIKREKARYVMTYQVLIQEEVLVQLHIQPLGQESKGNANFVKDYQRLMRYLKKRDPRRYFLHLLKNIYSLVYYNIKLDLSPQPVTSAQLKQLLVESFAGAAMRIHLSAEFHSNYLLLQSLLALLSTWLKVTHVSIFCVSEDIYNVELKGIAKDKFNSSDQPIFSRRCRIKSEILGKLISLVGNGDSLICTNQIIKFQLVNLKQNKIMK